MFSKYVMKWENWLNNRNMRTKIIAMFVFCVLIPIIFSDAFVISSMIRTEQMEYQTDTANMATTLKYAFSDVFSYSDSIAKGIYMNNNINSFLIAKYKNVNEYYEEYDKTFRKAYFDGLTGFEDTIITMYTDNSTVLTGGYVKQINSLYDIDWYKDFSEGKAKVKLIWTFDNMKNEYLSSNKRIYYLHKLDYKYKDCEKMLLIELNYGTVARKIMNNNYDRDFYICKDNIVLVSSADSNNVKQDYQVFNENNSSIDYVEKFNLFGEEYNIYIMKKSGRLTSYIKNNILAILMLIVISVLLPIMFILSINKTIISRITKLGKVVDESGGDNLKRIEEVEGQDEIGQLMINYNMMVDRINELIQTVYKGKLAEQESNIARKNAELMALHSQINPHFLFNALESIRMHSILKNEIETSKMIEHLALMERQNVEWGNDLIEISNEMRFVEAYLGLQKYRFGDRLMYELSVDDDCKQCLIPKLTIVTFVENACVHGIESKSTTGWIFVRISKDHERLVIEVEDTGSGIAEDELEEFKKRAENIDIDSLKNKKHVGVLNALLRVKMNTDNNYEFNIDSEVGVGTMVQLKL